MKKWLYIFSVILICCAAKSDSWKQLDLGAFTISIPRDWKYIKQRGEDSFIGDFKLSTSKLSFDCSSGGYANELLPTEKEYLKLGRWNKGYFYKVGVTYTADFNVHNERMRQMKEKGITDSSLVNVEADPSYETTQKIHLPTSDQKVKFPKADYIADLTFRGNTIQVPIEIPYGIKIHNIKIDSNDRYVYKTIWPRVAGKGMTGIYFHSRNSRFNFQMSGKDLSPKDQALALQAFKTIKFPEK